METLLWELHPEHRSGDFWFSCLEQPKLVGCSVLPCARDLVEGRGGKPVA